MNVKKYSLMQMPLLAFFSKRLYRDVGHNWKGANFAYLFLLLAVCCIPATLHVRESMLQSLEVGQKDILNQIPRIQIRDGSVDIGKKRPHYIRLKNGNPIAIIDTTGSMNYIAEPSVVALLTEDKLIVRRGSDAFNTFDLSGVESLMINKQLVNGWLQKAKATVAPLSYGIFLMLSYIFAVLTLLLVAILGLIIATILHNPLRFKSALRISSVAATPAIIFITLSAALGFTIPIGLYLGITLIYLYIGIKSCGIIPPSGEQIDLKAFLHDAEYSIEEAA